MNKYTIIARIFIEVPCLIYELLVIRINPKLMLIITMKRWEENIPFIMPMAF
jgi:hypothetical protein